MPRLGSPAFVFAETPPPGGWFGGRRLVRGLGCQIRASHWSPACFLSAQAPPGSSVSLTPSCAFLAPIILRGVFLCLRYCKWGLTPFRCSFCLAVLLVEGSY